VSPIRKPEVLLTPPADIRVNLSIPLGRRDKNLATDHLHLTQKSKV